MVGIISGFIFRLSQLLMFSSLMFLSACDELDFSNMAQNIKFRYSVNVGYPEGYYALYEITQSHFMDGKGKAIFHFGGTLSSRGGWGISSEEPRYSEKNVAPAAFKVRWFSPTEDQFWEGEFPLPQQKLYQIMKKGYQDPFNQNEQVFYSEFIINVAPGGLVVLWLEGGAQKFQIGAFQAEKIDMDWQAFARNAFMIDFNIKRSEYITKIINGRNSSEQTRQEIKTGTLPSDSAPWKRLQQKYPWRMQLNTPFVLQYFRAWHVNGESLFTYSDDVNEYQNRAVPYKIFFTFIKSNKQLDHIMLELDKEQTIAAYNKLGGAEHSEPLEFYLDMTEDLDQAAVYLKNRQEQVELMIRKIDLTTP